MSFGASPGCSKQDIEDFLQTADFKVRYLLGVHGYLTLR